MVLTRIDSVLRGGSAQGLRQLNRSIRGIPVTVDPSPTHPPYGVWVKGGGACGPNDYQYQLARDPRRGVERGNGEMTGRWVEALACATILRIDMSFKGVGERDASRFGAFLSSSTPLTERFSLREILVAAGTDSADASSKRNILDDEATTVRTNGKSLSGASEHD